MDRQKASQILDTIQRLQTLSESGELGEREVNALSVLKAQAPAAQKVIDGYGATYRGLQHDLTFGQTDTAMGVKSYLEGDGYESGRDEVRAKDRAAYTADPESFEKGQMGGAALSMLIPGSFGAKALKGAGAATHFAFDTLLGGGIGANQGIQSEQVKGKPPETLREYYDAAKYPALVGAATGAVARPLAAAGGAIARGIGNRLKQPVAGYGRAASDTLGQVVRRTEDSGRDIQGYLDGLTDEAMLVDVPEMRPTGRALTSMNGAGGMQLSRAITDRAEGAADRIKSDLDTHIDAPDAAFVEQRRLAAERTGKLGPEYDAVLAAEGAVDVSAALNAMRESSRVAGPTTAPALDRFITDLAAKAENGLIDPKQLHWIRSDLNDALQNQFGPTKGNAILKSALKEVDDVLDAVPGYKDARTGYGNNKAMDRAIDEGQGALRGGRVSALSPNELALEFNKLTDPQKDAFKKGLRRDVAGLMGTAKNEPAAAWGEFAKEWNEEKLRIVLGNAEADPIIRRLRSESEFSESRGRVTAGSDTNRGQAAMENLEPAREPGTNRQQGILSRAKENLFDKPSNAVVNSLVYGPRASAVNQDIGGMLSAQGAERDRIVSELLRRMITAPGQKKLSKSTQFIVDALARAAGGAATVKANQ